MSDEYFWFTYAFRIILFLEEPALARLLLGGIVSVFFDPCCLATALPVPLF